MTVSVLVVEDDETFSAILVGYLEAEGFRVEVVSTGAEMLHRVASHHYSAILLDLGLPDEDGLVLLRMVLQRSTVPVVVITGRTSVDTKLAAFDIGAADVLVKPLNPRELCYRVNNIIRRTPVVRHADHLSIGTWHIDIPSRTVVSRRTGKPCLLTRAEFDALVFLLRGNGRVYSRAQILDAITISEGPESERAIDVLISRLRKKLMSEQDACQAIVTVRGVGYRIDAK